MRKEITDSSIISVRRQANDDRVGEVEYENISGICWDSVSGGIHQNMGNYYLCGYVNPDDIQGEVACSGMHNYEQFGIKVVILKKDNKAIFGQLEEEYGKRPISDLDMGRKLGVAKLIREYVDKNSGCTAIDVATYLEEKYKIRKKTTQNAVRYLKTHDFKKASGINAKKYKNTQKLYIK